VNAEDVFAPTHFRIIAVDPGATGAIVTLDLWSDRAWAVLPRYEPKTGALNLDRLRSELPPTARAIYMERPQGRGGWSATSNFSIGWKAGQLLTALRPLAPVSLVAVREWQNPLHAGVLRQTADGVKLTAKERSRLKYEQLFPHDPIAAFPRTRTDGVLDALLIATWAAEKHHGVAPRRWRFL
jgi:hypothetical protein